MLAVLGFVLAIVALVALRLVVRERVIHPLNEKYGPMPLWAIFALIAAVVVSKMSRLDSSTTGLLTLISLIAFLACVFWLLWPRARD